MDFISGDFISRALSVFIGATLAFLFAVYKNHRDKIFEEDAYLKYAICCLNYMVIDVAKMRKDVVIPKISEVELLKNDRPENVYPSLLIKLIDKNFSSSIEFEKLGFLAKYNPKIIVLLKSAVSSYESIGNYVHVHNESCEEYSNNKSSKNKEILISAIECLDIRLKQAHYFIEKCAFELMCASEIHYSSNNFSFELNEERYKELDIEPIEVFEEEEYFSHKLKKKK